MIRPIARQASVMCHLPSPFSHTKELSVRLVPVRCLLSAASVQLAGLQSACPSSLNAIVTSFCGDFITSTATAIQMDRERSASHVSRQPHESKVFLAYRSNTRQPIRSSPAFFTAQSPLRFAPVRSSNCVDTRANQIALRYHDQ